MKLSGMRDGPMKSVTVPEILGQLGPMASALPVLQQPLDEILREMGFTKLKPKQLEAIVAVVSGNDTFLSLPTGYGKSVVVSLPAHTYVQWKAMADRRCCCWNFRATK